MSDKVEISDEACDRIVASLDVIGRRVNVLAYGLPVDIDKSSPCVGQMRQAIRDALNPPADPLTEKAEAFIAALDLSLEDDEDGLPEIETARHATLAALLIDLVRAAK